MQNFEDIIMEDCYYVDKTPFIELIEESNKYFFFIRHRRFSKSLTLSMLENYYDINKKDKFEKMFGKLYVRQDLIALPAFSFRKFGHIPQKL